VALDIVLLVQAASFVAEHEWWGCDLSAEKILPCPQKFPEIAKSIAI
jgi:hypothetical protein